MDLGVWGSGAGEDLAEVCQGGMLFRIYRMKIKSILKKMRKKNPQIFLINEV